MALLRLHRIAARGRAIAIGALAITAVAAPGVYSTGTAGEAELAKAYYGGLSRRPASYAAGLVVVVVEVRAINVHAQQRVDGTDPEQLERLARYRPSTIPQEHLTRHLDGRLELERKKIWRDGTRALVFEPHDLFDAACRGTPSSKAPPLTLLRRAFDPFFSSGGVPQPPTLQHRPSPAQGDLLELLDDRSHDPLRKTHSLEPTATGSMAGCG